MFVKFAKLEILDVKSAPERLATASLGRLSDFNDYRTDDGYLYVRVRAISSRVNKNHDGWPAEELQKSYRSFIGKPLFVDHHNSDPKKARGVVVDSALHIEEDLDKTASLDPYYATAPSNHLPPTWIELLLEVDAKKFPKLAKAIVNGDIDGVSMGANVERSICSHCQNEATTPEEYCKHIVSKGAYFDTVENGIKTSKKSYEDCYEIGFFELSFVFDPADETALMIDHKSASRKQHIATAVNVEGLGPRETMIKLAALKTAEEFPPPQSEMTTAPEKVDTLRQEQICPICGSDMEDGVCEVCNYETPPRGFDNPDLEKAKEVDKDIRDQDADQAAAGQEDQLNDTPIDLQQGQGPQNPGQGMPQPITSKAESTGTLKSEQKVSAKQQQDQRINTQERPILPVTRKLTDQPLNQKTIKDSLKPVESNRKEKMTETTQKIADGASPAGEGVQADQRVDVEGVGGTSGDPLSGIDNENVEKDTGDFTADATDTWSGEEGDSLPSADAVNAETGDFATVSSVVKNSEGIETWDTPGSGFPDHDPTSVDLEAGLAEEVGEGTATDSSEQFRSLEMASPVTQDDASAAVGGPIGVAVSKAKSQMFKALKVAEAEINLGLLETDAKFDRVAELEGTTEEALDAQMETLAKVKTAGLRKNTAQQKTAGKMPSFRPATGGFDIQAHSVGDEVVDDVIGW